MIRREVFGGLVFDEATHKIFTLDRPSFRVMELGFIQGKDVAGIQSELISQFDEDWSETMINEALQTAQARLGKSVMSQRGRTDNEIWTGQWHGQYFSAPVSNFWSFTNLCNLHCEHCAWNSHRPLPNELNTAQCIQLIDDMLDMGVCELSFSGGEPLTKKAQLLAMAQHGHELGFCLGLATNATMIDPTTADELRHVGIREVQVSFEGLEAHDSIRGRGVLERTFKGVQVLRDHGFDLTFSVTINKTNLAELDNIFKMSQQAGVRNVRFVRFVPIGRGKSNLQMFQLTRQQEIALAGELWKKRWELYPHTMVTFNKHYVAIGVMRNPQLGNIPPTFAWNWDCPSGRHRICVMPQGKVAPCPLIGSLGLSGGDVTKTPLAEIWEKSRFFKYIRSDKRRHDATCSTCTLWQQCSGGCKAASYATSGRLMAADPLCLQDLDEVS